MELNKINFGADRYGKESVGRESSDYGRIGEINSRPPKKQEP